jgi:hypothetical protein
MAFTFLYVMQRDSKFVSARKMSRQLLASSGLARRQVDFIPECVGQIHKDGFGSAADNDPLEGKITRRIDFLVGKPRRNIEEIARAHGGIEPSLLAPPNIGTAAEHVRDRVLLTVMVDCRAGGRLNTKNATPHIGESMPAFG